MVPFWVGSTAPTQPPVRRSGATTYGSGCARKSPLPLEGEAGYVHGAVCQNRSQREVRIVFLKQPCLTQTPFVVLTELSIAQTFSGVQMYSNRFGCQLAGSKKRKEPDWLRLLTRLEVKKVSLVLHCQQAPPGSGQIASYIAPQETQRAGCDTGPKRECFKHPDYTLSPGGGEGGSGSGIQWVGEVISSVTVMVP